MDKKRIVVRSPVEKEKVFLTLPFFSALRESFPNADIFLVTTSELMDHYSLLMGEMKIFSYDRKSKVSYLEMMEVHKYCVNNNELFNIDYFFSLEEDVTWDFMGYTLRAKERIGTDKGLKNLFLTKKVEGREGRGYSSHLMRLLKAVTHKDYSEYKAEPPEQQPLVADWQDFPYLVFYLKNNNLNLEVEKENLKNFFDYFFSQKFIVLQEGFEEGQIKEIFKGFSTDNAYQIYSEGASWSGKLSLCSFAKGVLTNDKAFAQLSLYACAPTALYNLDLKVSPYFMGEMQEIHINEIDMARLLKFLKA